MADIELVIKINEGTYNSITDNKRPVGCVFEMIDAIKNGKPLPKGHGRLIDAGSFVDVLNNAQIEGLNTYEGLGRAKELLVDTPTIIEADKESEE